MLDVNSHGDATDLETKTFSVAALLDLVKKGKVRIARFQRGFIWNHEDRRLLFDSIQSGYPIGTLLLARGQAPADRITLGGYVAEVLPSMDALWVVDGQQRLTTLAMALIGHHEGAYRPIFFDLEANKFVLGARQRAAPPRWIPTHELANSASLNHWLREANLPDSLSDRADKIAGRIRDYQVPAYLVPYEGQSDPRLGQIFARVNRGGRALKSHEVFEALHSSMTGEKPIEKVKRDLLPLGFGGIEASAIELAALSIFEGKTGRSSTEVFDGKDVRTDFGRVVASLSAVIDFLVNDCGVPHVELLPLGGALSTLARFFDLHPRPHERNRELLSRWFWRGTLSGDHRRDNRIDGRRWPAVDGDESASVQRLLRLLPPLTSAHLDWVLTPYRSNSARSRVELLAMCALAPRIMTGDEDGMEVPIAALLTTAPASLPIPVGDVPPGAERTLAQYLLHPEISGKGRITPVDLLNLGPPSELLATHGIDAQTWESLRRGELSRFVELRRESLQRQLRRFLAESTGADATDRDRLPLDTYFAEDSA